MIMGLISGIEDFIKHISEYNDYTHVISTAATSIGLLLFIYAIIASFYHIIQGKFRQLTNC